MHIYIFKHSDVLSVFDHSLMDCFMSLKVANTVSMISKCCSHHVVVNVENLLLVVLSRQCLLLGIQLVFAVQYVINNWLTVGLSVIEIELYVMNATLQIKQFCQAGIYVSNASM